MESIKKCGTCKYANISLQDYPCRVCNLGNGDCDCWESNEPVSAAVMTRSECESAIMEHAKQIRGIYVQYTDSPLHNLNMIFTDDYIECFNRYWDENKVDPIFKKEIINGRAINALQETSESGLSRSIFT